MNPYDGTAGPEPGKWASVALSIAMHAALIALLFYGVRWQSRPPETVEVDLVRALPAPPPAVEQPAPPPLRPEPRVEPKPESKPEVKPIPKPELKPAPKPAPKPDIAIKERIEKPKPVPREEPKPDVQRKLTEAKPDVQRKLIEEQLHRETRRVAEQRMAQEAAKEAEALHDRQRAATAEAAATAKALAAWKEKVIAKIKGNIVLPPSIKGNPMAVFEVELLPSGELLAHKINLKKESGYPAYDESVRRAILKSSPLPKPEQPELMQRMLVINFCPIEDSVCK